MAYAIRMAKERNLMGKGRFEWVSKCFDHFFENFNQIDDLTKDKLLKLEKRIEDTYQENEEKIRAKSKVVEEAITASHGYGEFGHFNDLVIQKEWERLERTIKGNIFYFQLVLHVFSK